MGASASVSDLYSDGMKWFQAYFDTDMYIQDFELMDKDNDGGLSYREVKSWIEEKAKTEGGSWTLLLSTEDVIKYAHVEAAKRLNHSSKYTGQKVFGIDDFRVFLVQLYCISVLWVHFKNADDDIRNNNDFGNLQLTLDEFTIAVHTLTDTHSRENIEVNQIERDFRLLDVDNSNYLTFAEVCSYCCKYIDPAFVDPNAKSSAPTPTTASITYDDSAKKLERALSSAQDEEDLEKAEALFDNLGNRASAISTRTMEALEGEVENERTTPKRKRSIATTVASRNTAAVDSIKDEIEKNFAGAKLALEKEKAEATIAALLSLNDDDDDDNTDQ